MKSIDFASALGEQYKNSAMIREYWRDLRISWQSSEDAVRRTIFYVLTLATAFLLLNTKALHEVTVLGLKVTNLALVTTFIPAVMGYLIYVLSNNVAIAWKLGDIHDDLARHYWPEFYENDLELTIRPTGSFAENALITRNIESVFLSSISRAASMIRLIVYVAAPVVFELYALWRLFDQNTEILWLECAVTAFSFIMILASVPTYIFIFKELIKNL